MSSNGRWRVRLDSVGAMLGLLVGFFRLERRAIENYFSAAAIRAGIGPGHVDPGLFGERDWKKGRNTKIARQMSFSTIESTDLGAFLKSL